MAKDLIINDKTAVKATSMVEQLDKLSVAREEFEKTDWARTNQKLYELLGAVYARYEEASAEKSVLALTVKTLTEILKKRGNRVQQNSTALSLFVRYVFNCDRQRIFTYTRAIHAASSHGITPDQLATFITTAGGVEECKKKVAEVSSKVMEKTRTIESAMPLVEETLLNDSAPSLAQFKVSPALVANVWNKGMTFMIGSSDAKGNVEVRCVIPAHSAGFEKWAKTNLALFLAQQQQAAEELEQAQLKDKAIEQVIASAKPLSANPAVTVAELEAA